jgi:hypothetical protein
MYKEKVVKCFFQDDLAFFSAVEINRFYRFYLKWFYNGFHACKLCGAFAGWWEGNKVVAGKTSPGLGGLINYVLPDLHKKTCSKLEGAGLSFYDFSHQVSCDRPVSLLPAMAIAA